jgi:oligosaccharide translocation protein RFT1
MSKSAPALRSSKPTPSELEPDVKTDSKLSTSDKTSPPNNDESASSSNVLAASAAGARYLILLSISSRLLTFLVNNLLLRYLSPSLLGISVQLELLSISILYFSRESLRTALQRQSQNTKNSSIIITNLALLCLPLGICFSGVLGWSYWRGSEVGQLPWGKEAVGLYVLATIFELASEPGFALGQAGLRYKLRAGAESAASLTRCFLTCGTTIYFAKQGWEIGALGFALGQLGYGVVLFLVYTAVFGVPYPSQIPTTKDEKEEYYGGLFEKQLTGLAGTMWVQAAIKHVLTQGDSLLVAWLTTLEEQGTYALAANYGGLVARMVLQPIEEAARGLFSKLLVDDNTVAKKDKKDASKQEGKAAAQRTLKLLLRLYLLFSVIIITLGPPFAPLALQLLAGKRWADAQAGAVLAGYCYYIPLLAVNGVTEAFVQSAANAADLRRQSAVMGVFSVGLGVAGWGFVKALGMGARGLVAANAVNMGLRIVWSGGFVRSYFADGEAKVKDEGKGWREIIPSPVLMSVAAVVVAAVRAPGVSELSMIKQIATGAVGGLALLIAAAVTERHFAMECWRMVKRK